MLKVVHTLDFAFFQAGNIFRAYNLIEQIHSFYDLYLLVGKHDLVT